MTWYYAKHGKQEGPIALETLRSLIGTGQVAPADLVWKEGMDAWKPAGEVPELAPAPAGGAGGAPQSSGTLGAGPGVASPPPSQPAAQFSGDRPAIAPAGPPPGVPLISAPPPTSGLAIASLVCGLVGFMLCYVWALGGIPAVICGHMALKAIRNSPHPIQGRGMAITGLVTGYLANLAQLMFIIVIIWAIIVGAKS